MAGVSPHGICLDLRVKACTSHLASASSPQHACGDRLGHGHERAVLRDSHTIGVLQALQQHLAGWVVSGWLVGGWVGGCGRQAEVKPCRSLRAQRASAGLQDLRPSLYACAGETRANGAAWCAAHAAPGPCLCPASGRAVAEQPAALRALRSRAPAVARTSHRGVQDNLLRRPRTAQQAAIHHKTPAGFTPQRPAARLRRGG